MLRSSRALAVLLRRCGRPAEASLVVADHSTGLQAAPLPFLRRSQDPVSQACAWPTTAQVACRPPAWEARSFSSEAADEDTAGVDDRLNAAAEAGDPEAVWKVIEEHGEQFSESNVTNSFVALAKVAHGKGVDEGAVHGNRSFQMLVDMVLLGIRRYSSKQLLSVVGSAAKLGFDDDMLMDTITSRLLKQVETLDAAQLVDLVTSLGEAETSPSVVLFDGLQARAEALGKDISPDMKAQLQEAYKKLGYHRLSDAAKEI